MNIEKLPKSRVKVTFDVTSEDFDKALDEAFKICNEKVTIKGFRKGAAPRQMYEKNFGVESLYDEALNYVLNEKAKEIYADKELAETICGKFEPNIESEEKLEPGKGFVVSISFDVYPEVSLGTYKGIKTKKAALEATEEEVNNLINGLRSQKADLESKAEQVIATGDTAIFDFEGSIDGVPFAGGKADNYELKIGSGQFIPGFEDQMIGMKGEEEKVITVTFPEQYQAKELAGKAAQFKVTVHEVKSEKLPELNDEFVESLAIENVKTVEELKANKKAELEKNKAATERDRQVDEIINVILDNSVVELPQTLIDQRVNLIHQQYENQAKMYNIPFDTFLGLMNVTKEKFDADALKQGERQALFNVVISKLIEVENLTPTKEEIEAKAEEEAANGKAKKEQLLREKIQAYYSDIAYKKVIDFLLANAELI